MQDLRFGRRDLLKGAGAATLALGLPMLAQAQGTTAPGVLTAAVLGSMANLHPWQVTNVEVVGAINLMFSNLVHTAPDGTIYPDLAVALPKITNDGQTYTFELHDNVRFHNGDKLTTRDVMYTWEEYYKSGRRRDNFKDFIQSITVENEYRIRFDLKRPNAGWLHFLTYDVAVVRAGTNVTNNTSTGENLYLGSKEAGSGPFRMTKFQPDAVAEFEAFPGYFKGAPAQKQMRVVRIPDASAQLAALMAGTIDIASACPPKDFAKSIKLPGIKGAARPSTGIFYSPLNRFRPPFDNVHLRRAFACAIDREFICNDIYYGLVTPTSIPAAPDEFWYDAALAKQLDYDPDRAKFHLRQGGQPRGFRFEAIIPAPSQYIEATEAAVVIQANLAAIGVQMDIRQMDFTSMYNAARAKDFTAFPNPSMQVSIEDYLIFNSYACGGYQADWQGHCVPEYDQWVLESFKDLAPEKKAPWLKKVLTHLVEDATSVWIGRLNTFNLWRDTVTGFEPSKLYSIDLGNARKA